MLNWIANFSHDHQKKNSALQSPDIKKSNALMENDEWKKKRNSILHPTDSSKEQSANLERIIPITVDFFRNFPLFSNF